MTEADARVRRATAVDVGPLTQMLGRAFFHDPLAVWACRSATVRRRMLASIHRARLRRLLACGQVWTTTSSAALWAPPGTWETSFLQDASLARGLLHPHLLPRLPLLGLGLRRIQSRHPHSPDHWYLSLLGTEPGEQGRGLGSAVLQPVLNTCDRDGVGAYLETFQEDNLAFYARHGFRVAGQLRLPRGPQVWTMWRAPFSDRANTPPRLPRPEH